MDLNELLNASVSTYNALEQPIDEVLDQRTVIMLFAVILEMLIPLPSFLRISSMYETIFYLGQKVNKPENTQAQRYFSGFMLPVLIFALGIFIVVILDVISGFDFYVALILLTLTLEMRNITLNADAICADLKEHKKEDAREKLGKIVIRDCEKLSVMGISKALSESVVLNAVSSYFAVLVWYIIAGIEGAVVMQLTVVMSKAFSLKRRENEHFGACIYRIHQALMLVPTICLALCLIFSFHPRRALSSGFAASREYPAPVSGFILGALGSALNLRFGGPRFYQGNLIRFVAVGGMDDPVDISALRALNKIRLCSIILICTAIIIDVFVI